MRAHAYPITRSHDSQTRPELGHRNERIPSSSLLSSHLAPIDSLHKKKSKKGCHVRPHSWKTSFRDFW